MSMVEYHNIWYVQDLGHVIAYNKCQYLIHTAQDRHCYNGRLIENQILPVD